ncbi:M20 family metallopeptidase [uncultured Bifidobacterium sp.]|uniref:M20 metallopeptidase family protein n=1 Tax=uncultured Bifidobacterium sp. TaxID=165187 RepID=UPI0028DC3856|nr:M20 family metallopeptidase [uncultured Bifidobacterium sp.]
MDFRRESASLTPTLVALRHRLHAHPELALDLPWTQREVLRALDGLGLEIATGSSCSSITAVLRGGHPGPLVLLRGDMDGLPGTEESGLPFAAPPGTMHACGHDLHTAGLVGAAMLLAAHREEMHGDVEFMFQPGEEAGSGAKTMIAEGVLEAAGRTPDAAYAIHVIPGPRGAILSRPGAVLAGSNDLHVTMHGRGGHGSSPFAAIDPVPALIDLAQAIPVMITRRFSVFDPVVASITQLGAGTAINVIPAQASLGATVRTVSPTMPERFGDEVRRLADGIASAHGCTADVDFSVLYPVTANDPTEYAAAMSTLRATFGASRVIRLKDPLMGSEDFSCILDRVPGAFILLASTPKGVDPMTAVNHSPRARFDDAVLGDQAAALATLVWARQTRGTETDGRGPTPGAAGPAMADADDVGVDIEKLAHDAGEDSR